MSLRNTLLTNIAAAAATAELLAAQRREVIQALHEVAYERLITTNRAVGHQLSLEQFDRDLNELLTGYGFVRPLLSPPRESAKDASEPEWQRDPMADDVAAFVARWTKHVDQAGVPE
jgi:hypothetical protein